MAKYNRILMALDIYADNSQIVEKGKQIVKDHEADLYLLHVIEPLAVAWMMDSMSCSKQVVEIESSVAKESQHRIDNLGNELDIQNFGRRLVRNGNPADEIHKVVKENDIDLIVMGTHGQSGLQLLLGSTANSVLHGISCDVLIVRIQPLTAYETAS